MGVTVVVKHNKPVLCAVSRVERRKTMESLEPKKLALIRIWQILKEYSDYNDWHSDKIYPYYSNSHVSIDISEYSRLTSASSTDNRSGLSTYEYEIMTIDTDKERQLYKVDISKIIEWIDANGEKGSRDLDLTGREKIRIDDRRDFFITRLNMTYDLETKEAQYVSLDGYILER